MHIPQYIYSVQFIYESCYWNSEWLEGQFLWCTTPGFRPVWIIFLYIHLMFSCTHDFIFVHNRLFPSWNASWNIFEVLSLQPHVFHHAFYILGMLNYYSSENCKFTMLSCLFAHVALSVWNAYSWLTIANLSGVVWLQKPSSTTF